MKPDPIERRLARRLAGVGTRIELGDGGEAFVVTDGGVRKSADSGAVRRLLARGALADDGEQRFRLSEAGRSMVRRMLAGGEDDLASQHQTRERRVIDSEDGHHGVTVDLGESPLAWLHARKDRDGRPLIDDAAFAAGERLRADFTRGHMMPSITANWSLAGGAARGSGHAGGIAEMTEAALSARLRVERALAAVGPELSGAVIDFCCFLKGIDLIESERGWPKRSAKLVLRLGLEALARYYGLASEAIGPEPSRRIRRG